jgi:hypothetical protein
LSYNHKKRAQFNVVVIQSDEMDRVGGEFMTCTMPTIGRKKCSNLRQRQETPLIGVCVIFDRNQIGKFLDDLLNESFPSTFQ